jgi:hypothetical protein
MNVRLLKFLLCVTCCAFICSCDYYLKNTNFQDIEPPAETHQFTLNLSPEKDTIEIFNTTSFLCDFNTYGLDIINATFTLGGKSWVVSNGSTFTINPKDYQPGYDSLSLVLYTHSGTGSIADDDYDEGYLVKKKWLLCVDGRSAPEIKARKGITADGYLKISWDKCDQYNFKSYEIQGSAGNVIIDRIISHADSCFYIDSCFVGGTADFSVSARVYTDNSMTWGSNLKIEEPYPTLQFQHIGLDTLLIYWNKSPYNAKYTLAKGNITVFESATGNFLKTGMPGFGLSVKFTLTTSPNLKNNTPVGYIEKDIENHVIGDSFIGKGPAYAYNASNKILYSNSYSELVGLDISSLSLLKSSNIYNQVTGAYYSCPTNSTKTAALTSDTLYIFNDNSLSNPVKIRMGGCGNKTDHFCLTDNDLVAIGRSGRYDIISLAEKKIITTITLNDYPVYSKWACITTSKDGKYACVVTNNGSYIYNIDNGLSDLIYTDTRSYRSAMFDINNPGKLLLTFTDTDILEIRNIPGFSLDRTIELPAKAEVLRNIDPESGNLLVTDYTNLHVIDMANAEMVFKMRSDDIMPVLYGNRLFSETGYTFNISDYLNK